jgi:hypothetical protein
MVAVVLSLVLLLCLCSCYSGTEVTYLSNGPGSKLPNVSLRNIRWPHRAGEAAPPLRTPQHQPETGAAALPSKPPETDLKRLRFSVLSILLPWLYFMSTSLNIPSLPKFVNAVINKGSTDVTDASATVYGNLAGIDALFTFLSVNLVGVLSDRFGRRPFMLMSSIGMQCVHL